LSQKRDASDTVDQFPSHDTQTLRQDEEKQQQYCTKLLGKLAAAIFSMVLAAQSSISLAKGQLCLPKVLLETLHFSKLLFTIFVDFFRSE
jgi:hypothetical protein